MKKIAFLPLILIFLFMGISCSAQTESKTAEVTAKQSNDIQVFYFHFSRRCATCQAVESVSSESIKELFGEKVSFLEFNLDEAEGKEKAKELNVNGQTLLIVKGDKKINITNEGFMYARTHPEKLKEIISDNITPLL